MNIRELRRLIFLRPLLSLSAGIFSDDKNQGSVRILTYHNVGPQQGELTVTPSQFHDQMDWLHTRGYTVIGPDSLEQWLRGTCVLAPKSVIITFDDGFEDLYRYAFPILQSYSMRAVFFLVPGWMEEKQGFLNWQQVKEMRQAGMYFGSHTMTHRLLRRMSPAIVRKEHSVSKEIIEQQLGDPVSLFCYPSGYYDTTALTEVRRAGYTMACSTRPGSNNRHAHPLILRRTEISALDTIRDFSAKLRGLFDLPNSLYWLYRRFAQHAGLYD